MYILQERKRKRWEDRRGHHWAEKWRGSEKKEAKREKVKRGKIPQSERDWREEKGKYKGKKVIKYFYSAYIATKQ